MITYFDNTSLEELVTALKPYQQENIATILRDNNNDMEKTLEIFFTVIGPQNTALFGGIPTPEDKKSIIDRYKAEFKKLICGNPDYEEVAKFLSAKDITITSAVYYIVDFLSAKLGVPVSYLVTPVIISIHVMVTMTRNVFCNN